MNICLIDPPGKTKGLNVGLGYLASSLVQEGNNVKVLDLNNYSCNLKKRLDSIKSYDVIGISVKSHTYKSALRISKRIRRRDLICGGPHITLDGHKFLQESDSFIAGVIGEGEKTLVDVVERIKDDADFDNIEGVIYKKGNRIQTTPKTTYIANLDSLPYPNYEVFDSFRGRIRRYPLITSRGCPYSCCYCSVGEITGKKWRSRKPIEVVKELDFAKKRYNCKSFDIMDDAFTLDSKRAKRICELLIEKEIDMDWSCPNGIRADTIDEELCILMKNSGCRSVSLGIESGDNTVFNKIKKGETLEDIEHAVNLLKKCGIKVVGSFIIGLPGDNVQRVKKSLQFAKKLRLDEADWNLLVPYPHTEVWEWFSENGNILHDWKGASHFGPSAYPVFETEDFSQEERVYVYKMANIKCRNYLALIDEDKTLLSNSFNVLKLVLRYDAKNLLGHLTYAIKNSQRVLNRVKLKAK